VTFRIIALVGVVVFGLACIACGVIALGADALGVDANLYLATSVLCAGALASSIITMRWEGTTIDSSKLGLRS
jgi:hypothetical protein